MAGPFPRGHQIETWHTYPAGALLRQNLRALCDGTKEI
jgi:hypothetical protein